MIYSEYNSGTITYNSVSTPYGARHFQYNDSFIYSSPSLRYDGVLVGDIFSSKINDNIGLTDDRAIVLMIIRSLIDNVGLTDSRYTSMTINRIIADAEGISDIVNYVNVLTRAISDSVGLTDTTSRLLREIGITIAKYYGIETVKPIMEMISQKISQNQTVENIKPSISMGREAFAGSTTTTTTYNSASTAYNSSTQIYGGTGNNPSKAIYDLQLMIENIKPQMFVVHEV